MEAQRLNGDWNQQLVPTSARPLSQVTPYDQPSMLGGAPTSSSQLLPVNDEPPDVSPETGPSVASAAFNPLQQEPSTFDEIMEEIMRRPLSMDDEHINPLGTDQLVASDASKAAQKDSSDMSGNNLFHVSLASEADLARLSYIHAKVSEANLLSCFTFKKSRNDLDCHVKVGRFHYGQAFAAENKAVVLKATNQCSGEIVGCVWLQLQDNPQTIDKPSPCPPGFSLPDSLHSAAYSYIFRLLHRQRRKALKKRGPDMVALPYYFIRSLDVSNDLPVDHQSEVHEKLVSFLSMFKPEHDIFAQVSHIDLVDWLTFLNLGWEFTGDVIIDLDDCPKELALRLEYCSDQDRTLSGLLRAGTGPRVGSQKPALQVLPSPTTETWPPRALPTAEEPASPAISNDFDFEPVQQAPPLEESLRLQEPNKKAIYLPPDLPASQTTVTVNFLADGDRPFDMAQNGRNYIPFKYLSYREVSTTVTVKELMQELRLKRTDIKGFTTMRLLTYGLSSEFHRWERGRRRKVLSGQGQLTKRTLAEWGWGSQFNPVWLVVEV